MLSMCTKDFLINFMLFLELNCLIVYYTISESEYDVILGTHAFA